MNTTKPKSFKGGPRLAKVMTPLQREIIKAWNKKILVHPSYPSIAKQLKCSDETVHRAVQKYLTLTGSK